ncbi:hypothetical protein AciX9_4546 (plasmid) [Granulicella tundricola MP5ACTX9]|uniref:Uncharacterized protein n=1 Tax=Granulicella tundricola (strain ATCC BAA-1859 / DSM 23138 / MP5ACTX9) TaxID=1198114 RepID=E8X7P8_GRATM|nr:hypothetical protein AciX9_4546 [Granulicella tundricola MP5ACTX9]
MADVLKDKVGTHPASSCAVVEHTHPGFAELLQSSNTVKAVDRPRRHKQFGSGVIANRVLLLNALRGILLHETWTAESFQKLTDSIRKDKKKMASDVMKQYEP